MVEKEVTGPLGETSRPFAFTLTLRDGQGAPVSGTYGDLTFDAEGTAQTTLIHGGSVTLRGLPNGTVCTVYEEPVPGYDTTVRLNDEPAQPGPSLTVTTQTGLTQILYTNHNPHTPPGGPTPTPAPSATPAPAAGTPTASPTPAPAAFLPGNPPTGDDFAPGLWGGLALAAAVGLGLLVWRKKRRDPPR